MLKKLGWSFQGRTDGVELSALGCSHAGEEAALYWDWVEAPSK